jgi:hypothetical protein
VLSGSSYKYSDKFVCAAAVLLSMALPQRNGRVRGEQITVDEASSMGEVA